MLRLSDGALDTVRFVTDFALAVQKPGLVLASSGATDADAGVFRYDLNTRKTLPIYSGKGKTKQLAMREDAAGAAFLLDVDTTKSQIRPWELYLWEAVKGDTARFIAGPESDFLPIDEGQRWGISANGNIQFSENGTMLYFGMAPQPVLQDTSLLPEEIVKVEVWTWKDERLYTEQKKRADADQKRSYPVVYHLKEKRFVPLGDEDLPDWRFLPDRNANVALAYTESSYLLAKQWEGESHKDVYLADLLSGVQTPVALDMRGNPMLSPATKYVAWWSDPDSAWYAWDAARNAAVQLTNNAIFPFYNEKSDVPDYPGSYGMAGWLANDQALMVYDKCDLWRVDPSGTLPPKRLTRGRETNIEYRYIALDPDERSIPVDARILLHQTNLLTKEEGYAWLDLKTGYLQNWYKGDFSFTEKVIKAKSANALVFSCENFQTFPDLLYSTFNPANRTENPVFRRVSNANPQQSDYRWGTIEMMQWTSNSGEELDGLLVKPEDFDPAQQYPMVVYYYERLSEGLHTHRAPDAHRSSINWTIYASRGYLVFIPDIHYRVGYPGESAYDAVTSGVTTLINKGFVDKQHIGLQGHSWGGYETAYIITRTNMFACAEAGAPVANMTSAYGGIRWESGLSRQFQYEHTQSRIGGTLWEYPKRYIDNSPLFALDQVNTPLLILHNDEDGAVPWYQGIELFTGMRRLEKPCWMLNYTGEPHWPVKLQNRIDFQTRMQQFFDHFLMGAPAPPWMENGVPPLEVGIRQGLD
ncbi:MAG: S9 family peptidase [Lewinellaceae bacterium]|nr:S9 family peptidase [Lewinellaceae bacterium]